MTRGRIAVHLQYGASFKPVLHPVSVCCPMTGAWNGNRGAPPVFGLTVPGASVTPVGSDRSPFTVPDHIGPLMTDPFRSTDGRHTDTSGATVLQTVPSPVTTCVVVARTKSLRLFALRAFVLRLRLRRGLTGLVREDRGAGASHRLRDAALRGYLVSGCTLACSPLRLALV